MLARACERAADMRVSEVEINGRFAPLLTFLQRRYRVYASVDLSFRWEFMMAARHCLLIPLAVRS